ncbi:DUF4032 domain-containing protein, partial [Streptomyces sp. SID11233]|nr:DUF4032 domain-containing protein [Streptomyces sp. SID11233]
RRNLDPAQVYHELLENRWYLSERSGKDVGLAEATRDYVERVLPGQGPAAG